MGDAKLGSLGSAFASVSVFLVSLNQQPPTFLAPGTNFREDNFSMDWGWGKMALGCFKCITFIVRFISNLRPSLI